MQAIGLLLDALERLASHMKLLVGNYIDSHISGDHEKANRDKAGWPRVP